MKKTLLNIIATGLLAAFALGTVVTVQAQDKEKSNRAIPFSGNINEIDLSAKTINIGKQKKRTFHITSETKIKKNGQDATLEDAAIGDEVGGSYRENADGKLEVASLRIGAKPEGEAKGNSGEKKEK